jgi:hypothetical protein
MVHVLSCGEPQIFNEFPFTRIEMSLKEIGGHGTVKQLFQVIILRRKLCFVYLITAKGDSAGETDPLILAHELYILISFLGNNVTIRNYKDET